MTDQEARDELTFTRDEPPEYASVTFNGRTETFRRGQLGYELVMLSIKSPAPEVTDEMVERGLKVSREFPRTRGLDNSRNVMRAVLEAALNPKEEQ